jgi:hypothetical protein
VKILVCDVVRAALARGVLRIVLEGEERKARRHARQEDQRPVGHHPRLESLALGSPPPPLRIDVLR